MTEQAPETPVEPDEDTGSPYDSREVEDGVGFHDPDATDLDPWDADWQEES